MGRMSEGKGARMATKKRWMYVPPKPPKPKVPDSVKSVVKTKADEFVESFLKPNFIKPPPKDYQWNYPVDIFTKWHQTYFYFCSTWRSPGPNAISEYFESRFARLEYAGGEKFNMAYMRYTGQWWEIFQSLTLEECIEEMRTNPLLQLAN
jgi:hypothetical protein